LIKLVACDLDGTLLGHDLKFSPRVHAAITQALERGVIVTLATGRGASPTDQFAAELGLSAPLVCLQGGQIYDPRSTRTLHETRLAPDVIPWIADRARERGWHLHFEAPGHVYMPHDVPSPGPLMQLFRVAPLVWLKDFAAQLPEVPHKFIVSIHDPAEREALVAELQALVHQAHMPLHILASHPYLVEGLPLGVSKASGLAWLAEYFNISEMDVLAIGDNDNDVSMLEWAGVGVALASGSPAAHAAADWVAPGLDEDGAAVALEKYVLR
jgi:hypothetical protein